MFMSSSVLSAYCELKDTLICEKTKTFIFEVSVLVACA